MLKSTDRLANEKAEREAAAKAKRRAEEAAIVNGLRTVIQPNEQLLGFARGVISGGLKGKLNIGPEAFFAPFVNVGLTERRVVLQHLHGETGRPSEILPHFFPLADLQSIHFSDIETFGGEPACRLVLRLNNEQHFRIRLKGESNFNNARALALVFQSLTSVRRASPSPTQRVCASCRHILDHPSKFCPYCGVGQTDEVGASAPPPEPVDSAATSTDPTADTSTSEVEQDIEKVTIIVNASPTDLLDDALEFLAPEAPVVAESPAPEETGEETPQTTAVDTAFTEEPITPTVGFVEIDPVTEAATPSAAMPIEEAEAVTEEATPTATMPTEPPWIVGTEVETPVAAMPIEDAPEAYDVATVATDAVPQEPSFPSAFDAPISEAPATDPPFAAAGSATWGVTPEEVASLLAPIEETVPVFAPEELSFETSEVSTPSSGFVDFTTPPPAVSETPDTLPPAVTEAETETAPEAPQSPAPSGSASAGWAWTPSAATIPTVSPAPIPAMPSTPVTPPPSIPSLPPLAETAEEDSMAEQSPLPPPADRPPSPDGPMRVHFHIDDPTLKIDEVVTGVNADDVVSKVKTRITPSLKFPLKFMVSTMGALGFAQEVVSRYNAAKKKSLPRPQSCREFLDMMEAEGYATIEETV